MGYRKVSDFMQIWYIIKYYLVHGQAKSQETAPLIDVLKALMAPFQGSFLFMLRE